MLTEFRILRQDLAKTKAKKMCQANAKKRPRRLKVPFGPSLCEVPTALHCKSKYPAFAKAQRLAAEPGFCFGLPHFGPFLCKAYYYRSQVNLSLSKKYLYRVFEYKY